MSSQKIARIVAQCPHLVSGKVTRNTAYGVVGNNYMSNGQLLTHSTNSDLIRGVLDALGHTRQVIDLDEDDAPE